MKGLIVITLLGILSLLAEVFNVKKLIYPIAIIGLLFALIINTTEWNNTFSWSYSDKMVMFDNLALAFSSVLIITALLWLMMAKSYFNETANVVEHTSLVLYSLVGALILVAFKSLVTLFLGVEILSIPLYVLAASRKKDILSNEAGFKYLIMGSFASAFLLFGIALLYGAAGSFDLEKVTQTLSQEHLPYFTYTGIIMILIAMAFKVSIAPFHFWTPDVYEGSPMVITALMSTIVKTAAFAAIMKLFMISFYPVFESYVHIISWLIIISLIIANLSALNQNNTKRLLAFSSISHAAIMMLLIIANVRTNLSVNALLYYAWAYSIANITAFAVLRIVAEKRGETIDSLKGLAFEKPMLAFAMIIAMISLAGIPISAGFFAKYYVFSALLISPYKWLIVVALLASVVSVFYYLKLVIAMFQHTKQNHKEQFEGLSISGREVILLTICSLLLIASGIYPDIIANIFLVK